MQPSDQTSYVPRWFVTLVTVVLAGLAVIANVITMTVASGSWLGLNDIQWHWVLLACAVLVALNAAVNRAVLTLPPTAHRIRIENQMSLSQKRLEADPQLR
jgi:uncharacterized membrane protein YbhN (UPF0104 family)